MTGTISTYATEKGYGFIKGDDGKDYFFHKSAVDKEEGICEDALVRFDQKASPKGLSAVHVKIVSQTKHILYVVPDEVYISKKNNVKGWETIDVGNWTITGSSRNSPDEARDIMKRRTADVGINALVECRYNKTTGSEPGTGKGVHYYSVHHYTGIPANIGKKSLKGTVGRRELEGIDDHLESMKDMLEERTWSNIKTMWMIIAVLSVIACLIILVTVQKNTGMIMIAAPIGITILYTLLVGYTDEDKWLKRL